MDSASGSECHDDREILREVLDKLLDMHNRLGHQLIAVQAVCAYLLSEQCRDKDNPIASVHEAVAMLSGTGIALADNCKAGGWSERFNTVGATDVFERIASMAEKSVLCTNR